MGDRENSVRSLALLKILTATSSILGILICISSVTYLTDLYNNDEYGYKNETITQSCETAPSFDPRFCEFLRTWGSCATVGILVGIVQGLVSILSLIFRSVTSKTRLACAAHGFAFVALSPVFILTLSYIVHPAIETLEQNKQEILFTILTGVDLVFSLYFTVIISLSYGLEVKTLYTRLSSTEQ